MGMYKGERQFIPISYGAGIYISSKEDLEANGFSLSSQTEYDEFYKQIEDFCKKNRANKDIWLTFYSLLENELHNIYPFNGLEVIDYEQGTVDVESDAFKRTMEAYKGMRCMLSREERGIDFPFKASAGFAENAIKNRQVIFLPTFEWGTAILTSQAYVGLNALGETPVAYGMPNVNGGKTPAFSRQNAAIRKTSENKANAYEFIKILMSNTFQSDYSLQTLNTDIPIRIESRKAKVKLLMQTKADSYSVGDNIVCPPASDEQVEEVYALLTDVEGIKNYANAVDEIIWKHMKPYFDGTAD